MWMKKLQIWIIGTVLAICHINCFGGQGQSKVQLKLGDSLHGYTITHFGLDSEGGDRTAINLLNGPVIISFQGSASGKKVNENIAEFMTLSGGTSVKIQQIDANTAQIVVEPQQKLRKLSFKFPLSKSQTSPTIICDNIDSNNDMTMPVFFIAPDFGHCKIELASKQKAILRFTGDRDWANYKGRVDFEIVFPKIVEVGEQIVINFSVPQFREVQGIAASDWKAIRRPLLGVLQSSANWTGDDVVCPAGLLANNSVSDPAGCSYNFYTFPFIFAHEPVDGFMPDSLFKRSLDFWLDNFLMGEGNMAAFWKYDLYVSPNANFVQACYYYVLQTKDYKWLKSRIKDIQKTANFLVRRDIDGDGLTESIQSGNANNLFDPERGDFYLEVVNFGHKNAYTNVLCYQAYKAMAKMLKKCDYSEAANFYNNRAEKIKAVYESIFYNAETNTVAGWISQDGKKHDYMFTFVAGRAAAVGLLKNETAKKVMQTYAAKLKELPFNAYGWGVPINLEPIRGEDMIQPSFDITSGRFPEIKDINGTASFPCKGKGWHSYNGVVSPTLSIDYLLGLKATGMTEELEKSKAAIRENAINGRFQNGIVNVGGKGMEHVDWEGNPRGYEGLLADDFVILTIFFDDVLNVFRVEHEL